MSEEEKIDAKLDEKLDSKLDEKLEEKVDAKVNARTEEVAKKSDLREFKRDRADGLVGMFGLIAILLLYGSYCWLKSYNPLNPPQRFNVRFHDVASLNYQAAVYVDGVRVGSVDGIKIRGSEDVLVTLKVNPAKIRIPVGSKFIILPNGVVGSKYVEIRLPPNLKKDHNLELLSEKTESVGDDPIRPEIVVNELVQRLNTIDFDRMQAQLSRSLNKLDNVSDHVSTLSKKMEPVADNANQTVQSVNKLATDMQAPVNQMHQILDQKHPLMKMMFGRPGHIKEETEVEKKSDKSGDTVTVEKKSKVKADAKDKSDAKDGATTTTETTVKTKKKHHFLGL